MPIFATVVHYPDWANVPVFIESHLEECQSGRLTALEVYTRYCAWCAEVGAYATQEAIVFGRIAGDMGIQKHKSGRVYYAGVRWRDQPVVIPAETMARHVLRPTEKMHMARRQAELSERESLKAAKRQQKTDAARDEEEQAQMAYRARVDESVRGWAAERLLKSKGTKVIVKFWYSDYADWCDEHGHERAEPTGFTAALARLGYPVKGIGLNGVCVGFDVPV